MYDRQAGRREMRLLGTGESCGGLAMPLLAQASTARKSTRLLEMLLLLQSHCLIIATILQEHLKATHVNV